MSAPSETKIDKSTWGDGPWQREPDRVEFRAHGFPCLMVRQPRVGHWCGYVGVPKGHPWHGESNYFWDRQDGPEVHGGITYGEACAGAICHVPAPGEPDDVWWIGFDCAHSGDLSPADNAHSRRALREWETYKPESYVRAEVERLAQQAAGAQR